jgi:peptidoglycan/LPS O-acetylase OafA/YrhL
MMEAVAAGSLDSNPPVARLRGRLEPAHGCGTGQAVVASTRYIGEIDGLRCFAMTGVVAGHCGLMPFGWVGVWLFFVISGFVVTKSLLERERIDESSAVTFRNFMMRRVLRIWPIYYAYMVLGVAVTFLIGEAVDWRAVAFMSTFTYNFYLIEHGRMFESWPISHLWTISVEEQFYLFFGFAFAYLRHDRLTRLLWIIVMIGIPLRFAASTYYQLRFSVDNDIGYAIYANLFCQLDAFSIGSLIAISAKVIVAHRARAHALSAVAMAAVIVYSLFYVGVNKYILGYHGIDMFRHVFAGATFGYFREVFVYSVLDLASASVICLILIRNPIMVLVAGSAIVRRIGRISYGAYVYHLAALALVDWLLAFIFSIHDTIPYHLVQFLFVYPLTIVIAELSFRYFEARCRDTGACSRRASR